MRPVLTFFKIFANILQHFLSYASIPAYDATMISWLTTNDIAINPDDRAVSTANLTKLKAILDTQRSRNIACYNNEDRMSASGNQGEYQLGSCGLFVILTLSEGVDSPFTIERNSKIVGVFGFCTVSPGLPHVIPADVRPTHPCNYFA